MYTQYLNDTVHQILSSYRKNKLNKNFFEFEVEIPEEIKYFLFIDNSIPEDEIDRLLKPAFKKITIGAIFLLNKYTKYLFLFDKKHIEDYLVNLTHSISFHKIKNLNADRVLEIYMNFMRFNFYIAKKHNIIKQYPLNSLIKFIPEAEDILISKYPLLKGTFYLSIKKLIHHGLKNRIISYKDLVFITPEENFLKYLLIGKPEISYKKFMEHERLKTKIRAFLLSLEDKHLGDLATAELVIKLT